MINLFRNHEHQDLNLKSFEMLLLLLVALVRPVLIMVRFVSLVGFALPHMGWTLKVPNGYANGYSFKAVVHPVLIVVLVSNTSPLPYLMCGKRKR